MATPPTPYVPAMPGDLITAENWNVMQTDVQQDIANQVKAGIASVKDVDHAGNADKLGGMTLADLTKYILDQAFAQLPKRTGYMQVLCNLEWANNAGVDKVIQHNLKAYPIVDIYLLSYFLAVCAKNDKPEDAMAEWVLFYLYHADERRLRIPGQTGAVDIETEPKFRILWKTLLDQLVVQKLLDYTDDTTLDDLEVDFWKAMFKSPPNDQFDPDSYCHSPWFEKCCGEKRTVAELTRHGDFDDIYLKVMPQNTAICAVLTSAAFSSGTTVPGGISGANGALVRVSQLDLDSVALQLAMPPSFSFTPPQGAPQNIVAPSQAYATTHLPVLALLKV
jgi:hypothetical protein